MVKTICSDIPRALGRIDILVSNARLALDSSLSRLWGVGYVDHIGCNVKVWWRLLALFLALCGKRSIKGHSYYQYGTTQESTPMLVRCLLQLQRLRLRPFRMDCGWYHHSGCIKVTTIQPGIVEQFHQLFVFLCGDKERAASVYQGN